MEKSLEKFVRYLWHQLEYNPVEKPCEGESVFFCNFGMDLTVLVLITMEIT